MRVQLEQRMTPQYTDTAPPANSTARQRSEARA